MSSKNPENEPLNPEPRPDAKISEGDSWTREDAIIHALLKGDDTFFKDLGGESKSTSRRRDEKAGIIFPSYDDQSVFFDRIHRAQAQAEGDGGKYMDYKDTRREGVYMPRMIDVGERHPDYYKDVLKNSFEELLFRVLEREYPQMRISVQEFEIPEIDKAKSNYLEIRLGSAGYREFLDTLLLRENLVLHVLEESCTPVIPGKYKKLIEELEGKEQLPEDFANRLIARAQTERLDNPVASGRAKERLKYLPKPISNNEIAGIIKREIDVELNKYMQAQRSK